ncbi:MAG: hypothetical protein QOH71_691 [Blastocatellia bacterium]|nr:hypothetical protein [Blastocatellia bacterium]
MAIYNLISNANRQEISTAVAVGMDGALLKQLPEGVPWTNYNAVKCPRRSARLKGVLRRIVGKRQRRDEWLSEFTREYDDYIWYLNTVCQPHVLRQARKFGVPCVVHSHELEQMFVNLTEDEVFDLVNYPKLIIACSEAARSVMNMLGRKENLEVLYEAIDLKKIVTSPEASEAVREKLNISKSTFVWAMSGTLDPNKNPIQFIELAREMAERKLNAHFIWIGAGGTGYPLFVEGVFRSQTELENLSWVGARTDDYYDYLNAADGFVLTSYRDSFPLTMLEAAALGKPIVSFDSGGVTEFVKPGMGVVIGSWDPADLTQAMIKVMTGEIPCDPNTSRTQAEKFDASIQARRWQEVMKSYFAT